VRKEIARAAGVGDRNVSNVRTILQRAQPILVGALKEGTLSINRAHQLCKLPKAEQSERFVSYSEERATNRVILRSIPQPREKKASLDVLAILDVLQRQEGSTAWIRCGPGRPILYSPYSTTCSPIATFDEDRSPERLSSRADLSVYFSKT
jgi:hypothetical protein